MKGPVIYPASTLRVLIAFYLLASHSAHDKVVKGTNE